MDKAMIPEKTSRTFRIPCFMFDCRERLRPAAFFDIAQEIAAEGSEQLHFADRDLAEYGLVWILARMKVKFFSLPSRGDSATIQTWHRGIEGISFTRDYRMLDAEGNPTVEGTSSWVIMDKTERKLVRPGSLPESIEKAAQCPDAVSIGQTPRINTPAAECQEVAGVHEVRLSDLDYNGHVNNAKYVVWAMDALPTGITSKMETEEISINFNKEARIGDTVTLFRSRTDAVWTVEGKTDGVRNFICEIRFNDPSQGASLRA